MGSLKFVSFRELRASTGRVNEMLADNGKIIVTNKGKPAAIMIQVSEADIEETLALINHVKLTRAINNIRLTAMQSGISEMTMAEIDAEIAEARKERRERLTKAGNHA